MVSASYRYLTHRRRHRPTGGLGRAVQRPFTLIIKLDEGSTLELHAYLQHVEAGRLGFAVQHVDRENMEPLLEVLQAHMDMETLEEELGQLGT